MKSYIYPGSALMPVMEIHSKWGTSEYRGNPNPLREIHPGPSYAVDLLGRGLQLGFIGGTDTHSTMPAGFGDERLDRLPGLTAVRAANLSRELIFRGVQSRNCYAASLERIYLDVTVGGAGMGAMVSAEAICGPRTVKVTAAAQSDIAAVEIIRNGQSVHMGHGEDWKASLEWTDCVDISADWLESKHLGRFAYYYVRVTCASGAQAWSSPVWIVEKPGLAL